MIASSWRNHFSKTCVYYWCLTDCVPVSLLPAPHFPCGNCHINTLLTGILKTTDVGKKLWNLQNISREWDYITRIYDENLIGRAHCRTQRLKHPHQASFSPKISAYTVEAIKYFKNTAWTINKANRQSTDQQISWKHSKKYHSAFKLLAFLLKRYHILVL